MVLIQRNLSVLGVQTVPARSAITALIDTDSRAVRSREACQLLTDAPNDGRRTTDRPSSDRGMPVEQIADLC